MVVLQIIRENKNVLSLLTSPTSSSQEHFDDHDYKKVPFTILFSVSPLCWSGQSHIILFPCFLCFSVQSCIQVSSGTSACVPGQSVPSDDVICCCWGLSHAMITLAPITDILILHSFHFQPGTLKWFYCSSLSGPQSSYTTSSFIPTHSSSNKVEIRCLMCL